MVIAALIVLLLICFSAHAGTLTPYLSDADLEKALQLRTSRASTLTEENYQTLVQKQTYSDLLEIYKPENEALIQTTYASFTPENTHGGGDDMGFGLHIVKRLKRTLPDGTEKVIDINELWAEDRITGGLFLPDEIRIKTLVIPRANSREGTSKNYLFDSIRVAWGPGNSEVVLARRSSTNQMRVPVVAPYSCTMCHGPNSGFQEPFLQPGETPNPESNVQDSHFNLRPEEQRGFKQYVEHLKNSGKKDSFIEVAANSLKDMRRATTVPGIARALEDAIRRNERGFLGSDESIQPDYMSNIYLTRQGYYRRSNGLIFRDVIEGLIEGKYRWWEPVVVIPFTR